MGGLTPRRIVEELDRYIVGQDKAKRTVAVALCNRDRRMKLPPEMRQEVTPKNILMVGSTGVGKTETVRRLAAIIDAPFLKVEATKYTEVGYVGRDVESIVHDLVEVVINRVYNEEIKGIENKAKRLATKRLVGYLCQQLGQNKKVIKKNQQALSSVSESTKKAIPAGEEEKAVAPNRQAIARLLRNRKLEDQYIEIVVDNGVEGLGSIIESPLDIDLEDDIAGEFTDDLNSNSDLQKRKVRVKEARRILTREEANKLLDFDRVIEQSIKKVEENSLVFIDELDKLIGPKIDIGRDISGEGVQRDLLPLLDGTTVMTRHGSVKTDHILFIAAGTFSQNKPTDLIPELQGRFPLQVELDPLSQEDIERIITEPDNSLIKQHRALLATEEVDLVFTRDGVREIARYVSLMNDRCENIGARRLHTVIEKLLEDLNFAASEKKGERVVVDAGYVLKHIDGLIRDENHNRYIL